MQLNIASRLTDIEFILNARNASTDPTTRQDNNKAPNDMNRKFSKEYQQLQQDLHKDIDYGVMSQVAAATVKILISKYGGIRSICDYGAGKCRLKDALNAIGVTEIDYMPYDPAFPEYGQPQPADLVCCIDVLEHIEPDFLDAVLDELRAVTKGIGYFTIATRPARKTLPDGRNAHLIIENRLWWTRKLSSRFAILEMGGNQNVVLLVVRRH